MSRDGQTEKLQPHAAFRKRRILLCFIVIVKLSGRFCVKPIYAHVSRFHPRIPVYVPTTHVMLTCIILRNFLRSHTRRNREKRKRRKERCLTICVGAKCLLRTDIFTRNISEIFAYSISLNLINLYNHNKMSQSMKNNYFNFRN